MNTISAKMVLGIKHRYSNKTLKKSVCLAQQLTSMTYKNFVSLDYPKFKRFDFSYINLLFSNFGNFSI